MNGISLPWRRGVRAPDEAKAKASTPRRFRLPGWLPYLALVEVVVGLAVVIVYQNRPVVQGPDTWTYLAVAHNILDKGVFTNPIRTPGYGAFLALVFTLFGRDNLAAAGAAQGALYLVTVGEAFWIGRVVLRRDWIAAAAVIVTGVNIYILGFINVIYTEGFTLFLITTATLALLYLIIRPTPWRVWLAGAALFAVFLTRSEWVAAPIPALAYGIYAARWNGGRWKRLAAHALGVIVIFYALVFGYMFLNKAQNNYFGITVIGNINLFGKVMQYHMQHDAPARYADIVRAIDAYQKTSLPQDPYNFMTHYPNLPIAANNWEIGGAMARTVILGHPLSFVANTIPVMIAIQPPFYMTPIDPAGPHGAYAELLVAFSTAVYLWWAPWFLAFAALWVGLLVWPVTRKRRLTLGMGLLTLLALYELVVASVGAYNDYTRIEIGLHLLEGLIMGGTVGLCLEFALLRPVLAYLKGGNAGGAVHSLPPLRRRPEETEM